MDHKGAQADPLVPILEAIGELSEKELEQLHVALDPPDAPVDYDKAVELATPLEFQKGRQAAEIRLQRRPNAKDAAEGARWTKAGNDPITVILKMLARCTGIPLEALYRIDAADSQAVLSQAMEWFGPFGL